MNTLTLESIPNSRTALALVVIAHVAAALLIVQLFEARRYVDPAPLLVSLLPATEATQESREVQEMPRRQPLPQIPEPARQASPEPESLRPVLREPEPAEPVIVAPPVPAPIAEPRQEQAVEPVAIAPEPPPRAITEVPVPPAVPAVVPAPVVSMADPEPKSIELPAPAVPAAVDAPVPPTSAVAAQEAAEIALSAQTLAAVYLRNPKPLYPNVSRRLGEQGTVTLRVFVTIAGDAAEIELKSSSGFPRLDRAALSAVRNWKFSPAKRGERVVDAWVLVPIRFTLKG